MNESAELIRLRNQVSDLMQEIKLGGRCLGEYPGDLVKNGPESFARGTIYFCGLNPGGSAEGLSLNDQVPTLGACPSQWYEHERGMRFGRSLEKLFGKSFRQFFFTNLIFLPSQNWQALKRDQGVSAQATINACWPIHELFIELIQPRVIIACGNDAFYGLASKLGAESVSVENTPISGSKRYFRKVALPANRSVLVGIPHLSWFHPNQGLKELLMAEGVPINADGR